MALDVGVYGARGIPSTYSGYETFLTELLPRLVERGHRVTMYCRRGEVQELSEYRGVRLVHLPAIRSKSLSTLTHGIVAALVARLARHDVVLVVNVANASACALGTVTGQPVVLNTDGQEWLRGKWGPVARWVFRSSARISRFCATALVSDCDAMAQIYRDEFGATKSTVIPYMYLADAKLDEALLRERLGVCSREFFLTGGRLVPENNIERVAAAYVRSSARWPLLVMGTANYSSPTQAALDALAGRDERVRLVGHIDDRTLFATLLHSARRYVHAHSVGGINPSLVEAMGCGADVLALDTPFNREALGEAGAFFADFDDELVQLLSKAACAEDRGETRRKALQARAADYFAPDDVVGSYEALLIEAAGTRARRSTSIDTRWGRGTR